MNDSSATTKAALWVGTVFLLGAALGGVLGYLSAHRTASAANPPLSEPQRRARRIEQLTRHLSLTTPQRQQGDAILLDRHAESKAFPTHTARHNEQVNP